jgi:phage shock protein C
MGKFSSRMSNFRRYPADGYVGGVCAGIAVYLDWNVRLVRALTVLTLIFGGGFPILLVYGVLWYVMEEDKGPAPSNDDGSYEPYTGGSSRYDMGRGRTRGGERSPSSGDIKARFTRLEQRLSSMEECVTSNDYELRRELRKLGA